jgi:hypothetical protein
MVLMGIVFIEAFKKWYDLLSIETPSLGAEEAGLAEQIGPK